MKRLRSGVRARLRSLILRRPAETDTDAEFRFHIEMETEKHMRAGMSATAARREAVLAFGGMERHREVLREGRRLPILEPIWHDLRFGARSLARSPGLALVAALTIGLGVGATTTVFSAVNALLLRPVAVPGSERLASVQEQRGGEVSIGPEGTLIPYERYLGYRASADDVFESLAAHRLDQSMSLRLPDATISVSGTLTSGNYFQTLRVQPVVGRAYGSDAVDEIVISHRLWTARFGEDPGVLGRAVGLDGRTVVIVGVAPAGFGGVSLMASDVWSPVGVAVSAERGGSIGVVPFGRLRPGVSFEHGTVVVSTIGTRLPAEARVTIRDVRLERLSMLPALGRRAAGRFLAMLLGMATLVLLIAAANIAGVMLARGFARRREMAVRLAIGAGRSRIVRHVLAEALMLFGAGGLLGVGLAWIGTGWLSRIELPPQVPPLLLQLTPDGRVLAFAAALTGLTGILFGLVPALRTSRPDLVPSLKSGASGSLGGDAGRLRAFFVAGQVALAVMLLLTGSLFARSLQAGLRADLGFEPNGVVAATINLGAPLDYDDARGRAFYDNLLERIRAVPGVEQVALAHIVLVSGSSSSDNVQRPDSPDVPPVNASYTVVSPEYFETMRIEIEAGRAFSAADDEGAPRVAIINRTLADRLWPGESPLGHRIEGFGDAPAVVVGMTGAGRYATITEEPRPFVFLPFAQRYRESMAIHVRAVGKELALRALADEVRALDADIAVGMSGSVRELVEFSLFPQRLAAQLVGTFGIVGLILAALGIYGVVAYQVARRTRELGVRRALGATTTRVVWSVLRGGAIVAVCGCVVGVAAGGALAVLIRSLLFGIRPLDPVTFMTVPAALFAVAVVATAVPALRASSVEATEALRSD